MSVTRMLLRRARPQLQQTRSLAKPLPEAVLTARKRGITHMSAAVIKGRYSICPSLTFLARPQRAALFSSSSRQLRDDIKKAQINNLSHRSRFNPRQQSNPTQDNSSNDNTNTNNMSDHSVPEAEPPLTFKSPKWLTAALSPTANPAPPTNPIPVLDLAVLQGLDPDANHRPDTGPTLRNILQTAAADGTVPRDTEILEIRGDMPSNEEWEVLGEHFTRVRYLSLLAGFEERWTDGKFPLNWPLELLVVSDAGAERVATPAILEGRIRNLVLCYTCGLRFEGPTTRELMVGAENIATIPRKKSEASTGDGVVQSGKEKNNDHDEKNDGSQNSETEERSITITSVPHEWGKYLNTKYEGQSISFPRDLPPGATPSQMTSLSVLGNDALETFTSLGMALPHLLHGLESLTLYAASQWDLVHVPTVIFPAALKSLERLKELKLTLGSEMDQRLVVAMGGAGETESESEKGREEEGQEKEEVKEEGGERERPEEKQDGKQDPEKEAEGEEKEDEVPEDGKYLHWMLPSGLEKLSIHGSVSMIPQLDALANAFESADFLPKLKSISLVLDFPGIADPSESDGEGEAEEGHQENEERIEREKEAEERRFVKKLAEAHAACKKVLDVAVAKRGAVVEGIEQPWAEVIPVLFKKVDKRWLELDGGEKE